MSNRLRTDNANCRTGMENTELAASEVISPSLLTSAPDPLFPRWLCPPQFKLGIGDQWETTAEQDRFFLEASQQLEPPALMSPRIRRLDDAEVRRRS